MSAATAVTGAEMPLIGWHFPTGFDFVILNIKRKSNQNVISHPFFVTPRRKIVCILIVILYFK